MYEYFNVLLVVICCFQSNNIVDAHGRLIEPPSRSSMWRFGFDTPKNYNDNQLFCGGKQRQYGTNGGKCGFCGDPYDGNRLNEAGGKYATGTIAKTYNKGSTIDVVVQITAEHKGWSQFKLCKNDNYRKKVTQECLDKHLLRLASNPSVTRHMMSNGAGNKTYTLQLPKDLACSQCVLQWQYHTGNSWGTDPDGTKCVGCGPQEEFYGCSDIAITDSTSWTTPQPPPTPPVTEQTREPRTQRPSSKSTSIHTKAPTAAPPTTGKRCYAYLKAGVGNSWCNRNCNNPQPLCPGMLCYCFNNSPYDGVDFGDAQVQRLITLLKWLLSGPYGMKRGETGY